MAAYSFAENVETVRFGLSVIAGIVASLGVIFGAAWKCGVGRIIKRRRAARRAEFLANVAGVVKPMIDASRAAALAQHDEQNVTMEQGFMSVHNRIDELEARIEEGAKNLAGRLDKGADHLARHDIDIAVLQAHDPPTHHPKDDHQ